MYPCLKDISLHVTTICKNVKKKKKALLGFTKKKKNPAKMSGNFYTVKNKRAKYSISWENLRLGREEQDYCLQLFLAVGTIVTLTGSLSCPFVIDSNEDQSESLGFQGGKACPEIPTGCLPSCFLGQVTAFIGEEGEGDWLARPLGDPMPETLACPTSGYNNLTTHKFRLVQCPYDPLTLTLSCSSLK